jgi:hypothetical protein
MVDSAGRASKLPGPETGRAHPAVWRPFFLQRLNRLACEAIRCRLLVPGTSQPTRNQICSLTMAGAIELADLD